jgi:TonB family protein
MSATLTLEPPRRPVGRPYVNRPGDWRYLGVPYRKGLPWTALLVSGALHALLIWGSRPHQPARPVHVPEPEIIQMVMPEILEEKDQPVEELEDPAEKAGVTVPSLMDVPTRVALDQAFVQLIEVNVPAKVDVTGMKLTVIPVKIARGGHGGVEGKIFDLSQLDRAPEPLSQPPPRFPSAISKVYGHAEVVVDFIVDSSGGVRAIRILSSTTVGMEQPVIDALVKWTFRPGLKGGRKVNVHMRQPFKFNLLNDS